MYVCIEFQTAMTISFKLLHMYIFSTILQLPGIIILFRIYLSIGGYILWIIGMLKDILKQVFKNLKMSAVLNPET